MSTPIRGLGNDDFDVEDRDQVHAANGRPRMTRPGARAISQRRLSRR
jgi:hypothetical protein